MMENRIRIKSLSIRVPRLNHIGLALRRCRSRRELLRVIPHVIHDELHLARRAAAVTAFGNVPGPQLILHLRAQDDELRAARDWAGHFPEQPAINEKAVAAFAPLAAVNVEALVEAEFRREKTVAVPLRG